MTDSYLVHLADGTEYGPVDKATLVAWREEGRLPATALVWPEGAPEWQSVEAVLGGGESLAVLLDEPGPSPSPAASRPVATVSPAAPRAASRAAGRAPAPSGARAASPRTTPGASPAAKAQVATPQAATPQAATPQATAPQAAAPQAAGPAAVRDDSPDTRPPFRSPRPARAPRPRRATLDPALLRRVLWAGAAVLVVVVVAGGLLAVLRPLLARSREIAAVKRHALPERHLEDSETGLVADLPAGWFALRPDNPFVKVPEARLILAQPSLRAFGTVVGTRPRLVDEIDAHLDELIQQRLVRRPESREEARFDVQLGRGRGRMVRTVWRDGSRPMVAAAVAWADGYEMLTLETWAPAEAGAAFSEQVEALCRGLRSSGALEARVGQAVDRLALEVPELSPDVLRLLVAEHMSRNQGLEGVPSAALLMVSRGLDALTPAEAEEMRVIYQQVWEPVPEMDRERMAALLQRIRSGREIPAADLQLLREVLKAGTLALTPEQRTRLQQLSGRAVRRALSRP